jgi:transketolase
VRIAFAKALAEIAQADPRPLLLTGDLGFMALEPFAEAHPGRFFNMGVAEQNMIGVGTGLAESGFVPFLYSIGTFASLRGLEFIRNGPILHHLPVRIVGVGGGFEYGPAGLTHYGLEDVGIMRTQPGLTVVIPADHQQARSAFLQTWDLPGPVYYRLGKDDKSVVPGVDGRFELGRSLVAREGDDLLLITIGSMAGEVVQAADLLATEGIESTIVIVSSFNPDPVDDLVAVLRRFRFALTAEAHYLNGGLGSWIAEVIAERGLGTQLTRCGVRQTPSGLTGSQAYMHRRHGLDGESLAATARQLITHRGKVDRAA